MAAPTIQSKAGGSVFSTGGGPIMSGGTNIAGARSGVIPGVSVNLGSVQSAVILFDGRANELSTSSALANEKRGAYQAFTSAQDFSGDEVFLIGYVAPSSAAANVKTALNQGVVISLISETTTTPDGYKSWVIGRGNLSFVRQPAQGNGQAFLVAASATAIAESAFNIADIVGVEITQDYIANSTTYASNLVSYDNVRALNVPCIVNGELGSPASFDTIYQFFANLAPSPTFRTMTVSRLGLGSYLLMLPVQFGRAGQNVYVDLSDSSTEFFPIDDPSLPLVHAPDNFMGVGFVLGSASECRLVRTVISSDRAWHFRFTGHASATLDIRPSAFIGPGETVLDEYWEQFGGAWSGRGEIQLNGASLDAVAILNGTGNGAFLDNAALLTGCVIAQHTGAGIRIDVAGDTAVDLSANTATLRNNGTHDVLIENSTPGSGQTYAIDISGLTQAAGSTTPDPIYVDDDEATNTYNITTNATYTDADASSAGAVVNIIAPVADISVSVVGTDSYYVAILDDANDVVNAADYGLQTGTYSFIPPGGGTYTVRVRREGWSRGVTTVTVGAVSVEANFELTQLADSTGAPLFSGSSTTALEVAIDSDDDDHRIDFTGNATVTVQQIFDELETASVSLAGLAVANLTSIFTREAPLLSQIALGDSVKLRNDTPANQNCVVLGVVRGGGGLPIDDGAGNGMVQVVSSLGLSPQETRDALLLAPTVGETAAAGSIDDQLADIAAAGGGGGASAADIADAVLDEALSGHTAAGTLGRAVADILEDTGTTLPSTLAAMQGAGFDAATDSLEALRNRGDSAWITANVSGLLTSSAFTTALAELETYGDNNWATATGFLSTLGANAPANWINAAAIAADAVAEIQSGLSTFDGDLSPVTDAIAALPTPLDATATQAAAAAALTAFPAAKPSDVEVTVDGGFADGDRTTLEATEAHARRLAKQVGLVAGVTATHAPDGITVSDGDGSTSIADNGDNTYTVQGA